MQTFFQEKLNYGVNALINADLPEDPLFYCRSIMKLK